VAGKGLTNVIGRPVTFWGKLRRNEQEEVAEWHPLTDHCADVAAVAESLLDLPVWRARLSRLAGRDLDDVTRARLSVLAALHDLGKFNLGFQAKGRPELGATAGHVSEALGALWGDDVLRAHLAPFGRWGLGATGLLVSSICHHGRPQGVDAASAHYQRSWWSARLGLDPAEGAATLIAACRHWFPRAFDEHAADLPEVPAFEHAFAGLVMLADWLGSDTRYFPYSQPGAGERILFARKMAAQIAGEMALAVDLEKRADAAERDPFARISPAEYSPRAAQSAVLQLPEAVAGSIAVLESETGSGKTEAALAHFVRLYASGAVDGLYFALPTRTAATQLFERVLSAVGRAFVEPPPVLLAVPGYLRVDEARGTRLPHFEVLWPDRDRFRFRAWAAEQPKRYLVGAIVVGTIDQVLLSSLMVSHAHLRATALLRQLLVVDEVHASDAYMTRILEHVLGRHIAAGGHALLLSATLGGETKTRLLEPMRPRSLRALPALPETLRAPYPLITQRDRAGNTTSLAPPNDTPVRAVQIEPRPWLEDPETVAAFALAAARQGAKVLVIKNTVRDCVATQRALEQAARDEDRAILFSCAEALAPHHARFARGDREALDRALEQRIGKDRPEGGCVVVATQTVQQSLDIDADLLLTDLCPADVLLQRIGRLHRHRRARRPEGWSEPHCLVMVSRTRDLGVLLSEQGRPRHHHGLGTVYPDLRILEATWRLVERHPVWRIPEMNRMLVEHSVHSQALAEITSAGDERWQRHEMEMIGLDLGQRRQAELNIVDWSQPYSGTSFPSGPESRIPTRLGEEDRRVRFAQPIAGPFGIEVSELVVRAPWAQGVPTEIDVASLVETRGRVTRFQFGAKRFVYDRLGLDREEDERDVAEP
jgi:CRISPR-associated endonuclease/helicase Cas3